LKEQAFKELQKRKAIESLKKKASAAGAGGLLYGGSKFSGLVNNQD
jgi:hypothetical protein